MAVNYPRRASPVKGQDRCAAGQGFRDAESGGTRPVMGADLGEDFSQEIVFLLFAKVAQPFDTWETPFSIEAQSEQSSRQSPLR
jgi:hypothetical protein